MIGDGRRGAERRWRAARRAERRFRVVSGAGLPGGRATSADPGSLADEIVPEEFERPARLSWIGPTDADSPLHKGVYILPNLFTTAGLCLGVYSIMQSAAGHFIGAAWAIVIAHVCDGLDGRIARLTRTTSRFGVEYDSLADLVAFGVGPGMLIYLWTLNSWGHWGWFAASLFVTCGALRLARFNVQVGSVEKSRFVGLPIPAAADMVAATVLLHSFLGTEGPADRHLGVLLLIFALAILMVSNVPYRSFKELDPRTRKPFVALVGLIILGKFVVAEPELMFFAGISVYCASGPVGWLTRWVRVQMRRRARVDRVPRSGGGPGAAAAG